MANYDPYPTQRKEINLRREMESFLAGEIDEIAKGRTGIIRKMRKDASGDLIRCPCRDQTTDEPDKDYNCYNCKGHGYFWDEYEIVYYKNSDSFRRIQGKNREVGTYDFYMRYSEDISSNDFLVTLKLDPDGNVILPLEEDDLFEINSAIGFRGDQGRIEFWQVKATEVADWSVHYGNVKNRQY